MSDNDKLPTPVNASNYDLWTALKAGNPDLAVAPIENNTRAFIPFDELPGFKPWLLSQYALGWPSKRIIEHLSSIRDEQRDSNERMWPDLGKRDVDRYRSDFRFEWAPIQSRLTSNIENIGVLAKNRRLLDLAKYASEIEEQMWDERDKSNHLYLLAEYRATLRQIAEEKGELGEEGRIVDNTLLTLANLLADNYKVQGAGLQQRAVVLENDYDYEGNDDEATTVRQEGRSLQADEVPPDEGADRVPQDAD